MQDGFVSFEVNLSLEDGSSEELDRLTRSLRTQLADTPVERADLVPGVAPPAHAKGADPVTLGALAIVVLPALLPKIVEFLGHFTRRNERLVMKIKLAQADRSIELELPASDEALERMEKLVSAAKASLAG